ncbi:hypothetical protein [Streptomyces sp. ISL-11]|uniref:hypothetical protein n=1 Tax=Streptomyces sp. ISL-11 TaxID=2819174 RepID=UPI001BE53376|nr:hypothetical protein [Streptomyces sp. ISL-11]MBT2387168.1 hypothetical protein [Streptomyces sp. ISL-11]
MTTIDHGTTLLDLQGITPTRHAETPAVPLGENTMSIGNSDISTVFCDETEAV